ncbi:MAG: murein L,D-transpeptidase family protein [Candidatus Eisenbacteria bacterium]
MFRSRRRTRGSHAKLYGVLGLTTAVLLAVLFTVQRDPEPTAQLLAAQQYLNLADESEADLDAPQTYEQAKQKLQLTRSAMLRQYGRPAFLRSYGETRRLLLETRQLTSQAIEEGRRTSTDRLATLEQSIGQIREEAQEVRQLLLRLPPRYQRALRHVVSAESRMTGAERKLSAKESRQALEEMQIARGEVTLALRDVRSLLLAFLQRQPEWNEDLRETLAWSRSTGGSAIVIDKLNHEAHLVRGGRSVETYPAEFGPGWLDRKIREGDRATPEGRYRISAKKTASRYHKALLIDYPNQEDRVRFQRMRNQLHRGARIGGLIEIHGEGGKGEDWTFGCISLRNRDIDAIFPKLATGTPVTIIGCWEQPAWLSRALSTAER